jgi:hypothetical protein
MSGDQSQIGVGGERRIRGCSQLGEPLDASVDLVILKEQHEGRDEKTGTKDKKCPPHGPSPPDLCFLSSFKHKWGQGIAGDAAPLTALSWLGRFKPRRAVITNMHSDLDYEVLRQSLPPHVTPA